jgi:hypothetical protein
MTIAEACSEGAKANAALLEAGLAIAVNPLIPFRVGDKTRLSWPQAKDFSLVLTDNVYASINEYRQCFSGGHYMALLQDGALVQVSYDFRHGVIVGYRFCYYPCPLLWPEDQDAGDWDGFNDLLQGTLYTQIEDLETLGQTAEEAPSGSAERLQLRSPIRFDYAPETRSAIEPASHVHISGANARIPVYAPLSLGQFLHFVIKHYYPTHAQTIDSLPIRYLDRSIEYAEECTLHFNWRRPL